MSRSRPVPLAGFVICVTGLTQQERAGFEEQVTALGGTFSRNLHSGVTHLVAAGVSSEKYKCAVEHGIPVLSTDWISRCWKKANENGTAAEFDQIAHESRLPPFTSLIICASGFDAARKAEIRRQTTSNGGSFSEDLSRECTHLVAKNRSGRKFVFAERWGVPTASEDWFFQCIKAQACLDVKDFPVPGSEKDLEGVPRPHEPEMKSSANPPPSHDTFTSAFDRLGNVGEPFSGNEVRPSEKRPDCFEADPTPIKRVAEENHAFGKLKETTVNNSPFRVKAEPVTSNPPAPEDLVSVANHGVSSSSMTPGGKRRTTVAFDTLRRKTPGRKTADERVASMLKKVKVESPETNSVFSGLLFCSFGFTSESEKILRDEITSNDGYYIDSVESAPLGRGTTYLVCPLDKHPPVDAVNIVSECWVSRCIADKHLHSPSSNVLFRPLAHQLPLPDFASACISITGYEGIDRQHLSRLIEALGAKFTDFFGRKNTHLIAKPSPVPSKKLEKAKEWGIPCVAMAWINDCAEQGEMLPVSGYTLSSNLSRESSPPRRPDDVQVTVSVMLDDPHPPPSSGTRRKNSGVADFISKPRPLQRAADEDYLTKNRQQPTPLPDKFANSSKPNARNKRLLEEDEHDCTHNYDDDDDELLAATYRPKFDTTALQDCKTPPSAQKKPRLMAPSTTDDSPLHISLAKNLGKASKTLDRRFNGKDSSNKPDSSLRGLRLCLSDKVLPRRVEFTRLLAPFGVEVLLSYSDTCTHFVHQSNKPVEYFKEFRYARTSNKFIVSPAWVEKCAESGKREPESEYPHTFNPNRALDVAVRQRSPSPVFEVRPPHLRPPSPSFFSKPPDSADTSIKNNITKSADFNEPEGEEGTMTVRVPTPPTSDIVRKTTDAKLETGPSATEIAEQQALAVVGMWMDSMQKEDPKAKPRLHEAKLKLEARRLTVVREDGNSSDGDDGRKASHPRSITGSEKHVVDNTAEVLYLDPETRMYKNQLIQLARSSSSMSGGTAASAGQSGASPLLRAEQAAPNRSDLAPPSNRPRPKFCDGNARFLMTGLSADDKARIGRQLQELGAQVIVSDSWSDGCTHLLCPKPSMTEKCLAACASGAWLMKPDYVAACANAGRMLEEEDWEWTSADTEGAARQVVEAARFWRKKLGNSRRNFEAPRAGCFEKWTVLLVMSNNRRLLYSRVLKAGGAYVAVETVSTMSKAAAQQSFSHCVTDSDIAKTEGFQDLSRQGVTVSPSSLILDFITKFRQFNPKN